MKKLTAAIGLVLASAGANAITISYSDFSDLSAFQLNGSAAGIPNPAAPDNSLRLTNDLSQSGSAFLTDAISLNDQASFSARFDFRIFKPTGSFDLDGWGADGLSFVVQTVSNSVGGAGGGIGYRYIPDSVGVEFDTWNNPEWDDADGNHVGINLEGSVDSVAQATVSPRMNNGEVWTAWIDYDGVNDLLEVRVSDTGLRSGVPLLSYNVDLVSVLGSTNAFIGFTSGTGSAGGHHDILNFDFRSEFNPIVVSEPAPFALLALSMFGLMYRRFRKA
jgi:hypothetical protein